MLQIAPLRWSKQLLSLAVFGASLNEQRWAAGEAIALLQCQALVVPRRCAVHGVLGSEWYGTLPQCAL